MTPAARYQRVSAVFGEVHEIDPVTLAALDRLEGHPRFYQRTTIPLEDGDEVLAYLLWPEQARGRTRIPSGGWTDADRKVRSASGWFLRDAITARSISAFVRVVESISSA